MGATASRLAAMKSGARPIRVVDWPGRPDQKVGIRVLSHGARQDAYWAARAHLMRETELAAKRAGIARDRDADRRRSAPPPPPLPLDDAAFFDEEQTQLLFRALVEPDELAVEPVPFASTVDELRRLVTTEERAALLEELADWQAEQAPARLTEEDLERLVEAVKKEPHGAALSACSSSTLRMLVRTLAEQSAS